jgi:hypothetical protein
LLSAVYDNIYFQFNILSKYIEDLDSY